MICSLVKFQEQETKLRPSPLLALCPRKTFVPRAGQLCPFLWVTSSPGWVAAPDRTEAVPREAPVGLQAGESQAPTSSEGPSKPQGGIRAALLSISRFLTQNTRFQFLNGVRNGPFS